jgi:hypothetical protein
MSDASTSRHQPLLGVILERENILTRAQVLALIAEQKRRRVLGQPVAFGQIALDLKMVTPRQLQIALQLQAKLAVPPGQRKRLGLYLLEAGLISASQLLKALEEQAERGGKLGEILIARGWLNETMLEMFLALQANEQKAAQQA